MRTRIAVAVAVLTFAIILAQALTFLFLFHEMEEEFIDEQLASQLTLSIEDWRRNGQVTPLADPDMTLYQLAPGDPGDALPEFLRGLTVGNHEVMDGEREYHVAVRQEGGSRFVLSYDVEIHEQRLATLSGVVLVTTLFMTGLVLVLVYALSGHLTSGLAALARRLTQPLEKGVHPDAYATPGMAREVAAVAHALDAYEARQQGLLEREREVTANLSHELRTPLTVIRGNAELIATQADLPPAVVRRAGLIVEETIRIAELANSLLLLARSAQPGATEAVALSALLAEVWQKLEGDGPKVGAGGTALVNEIPPGIILMADPAMLTLVLRNLLENALRHGARPVRCRLDGCVLEIVDSGPGFAAADSARLFERFYRSGGRAGHGLGLALVKHICSACGWQVSATNADVGGACLRVDFGRDLRQD